MLRLTRYYMQHVLGASLSLSRSYLLPVWSFLSLSRGWEQLWSWYDSSCLDITRPSIPFCRVCAERPFTWALLVDKATHGPGKGAGILAGNGFAGISYHC